MASIKRESTREELSFHSVFIALSPGTQLENSEGAAQRLPSLTGSPHGARSRQVLMSCHLTHSAAARNNSRYLPSSPETSELLPDRLRQRTLS
jgi:hypothetical protein